MRGIIFILVGLGMVSVSGCGRYSKPQLPKDAFYPHTYFVSADSNAAETSSLPIQSQQVQVEKEIRVQKAEKMRNN